MAVLVMGIPVMIEEATRNYFVAKMFEKTARPDIKPAWHDDRRPQSMITESTRCDNRGCQV